MAGRSRLTVTVFGEQTKAKAQRAAREELHNEAGRRGLYVIGKISFDADEKTPMWWNCEASADVSRTP